MKILNQLLLLMSILCSNPVLHALNLLPSNTILLSDIDDVIISKSFFLSAVAQVKNLIGDYKKDKNGIKESLQDKKGNTINGITFHLLYHGMRKPYLTSHVAWMVNALEKSRCMINGTEKIYRYLKDVKGYTIIFATNKDHISYDITANALGNRLTSLASKVFVAHPGNSSEFIAQLQAFANLPSTPASYKEFLQQTLTIKPTEMILHAPDRKPTRHYYEYIENHLGSDKNMVFIDDKVENVVGFKSLQSTPSAQRIGIIFKDPVQLAQEFVNLGILSEVDDQQLLEEIRYPGIWGKIRLLYSKTRSALTI